MDEYQKITEKEIIAQKQLLAQSQRLLETAPPGRLFCRQRKTRISYYQIYKQKTASGWRNIQRNITNDPELIRLLTEKALAEKTIAACKNNLALLQKTEKNYQPCSRPSLLEKLPSKYRESELLLQKHQITEWVNAPYRKAAFDPKHHIHETAYGELVRSKSEVIIANALFTYGIPFHYEELFPYPNENGDFYYPDFTILLPEGNRLYWEHFGLLQALSYCIHNAQKLHTFQQNRVFLGKNLILTQDDSSGNCNSAYTYDLIEKRILPLFKEIPVAPEVFRSASNLHRANIS